MLMLAAAISLLLIVLPGPGLALGGTSTAADSDELPPIEGCVASVAGGVGLLDGVATPAGGIELDVPGPVVKVVVEWLGRDDAAAGVSNLALTVTGPSGVAIDPALPGNLAGTDNTRIDGTGEPVFAWWADITPMFGTGDPGLYDIDIASFATPGVGLSWGAAVTVVYDTTPCAAPSRIIWKIGADYYYGGNDSSSKTTDLLVYHLGEPLPAPVTASVRMAHGDADHTAGRCRASNIWLATGSGPAPLPTDDLVGQDGVPVHPGAIEAVRHPFTPSNQPCPAPELTAPVVGISGGNIGPQFGLVGLVFDLAAGTEWVAFQIESPADNNGRVGLPESGAWGGAGVFTLLLPPPPDPAIHLEKTVLAGHDAVCPGTQGTDEMVKDLAGAPITYCFRVENRGNVDLFPVTLDDPDLGITVADMTLVSGDDSVPLGPGGTLVYHYRTLITSNLVNVAGTTGIAVDEAAVPIPGLDPVSANDDAAVAIVVPGIMLEKTVVAGPDGDCPGVEGEDELVSGRTGAPVTYCFRVRNTGETSLFPLILTDTTLGVDASDMTLVSGNPAVPLAPDAEVVFSFESTITADLVNVATVEALPLPLNPAGIPAGVDPVSAGNDAQVVLLGPDVLLEKTVVPGHAEDACPGVEGEDELVIARRDAPITYCFRVINTGNTPLFPVSIADVPLSITHDDLDLISGDDTVPLLPGEELVYAYRTTLRADMINVAVVTATPSDTDGDPLEPGPDVSDDNDARIRVDVVLDPEEEDDDDDDDSLPNTGSGAVDQVMIGLGLLIAGATMLTVTRRPDRNRKGRPGTEEAPAAPLW